MKSMKKSVKIALGILVVLMVIGLGCWIGQQIFGLGITGMSNGTSWGLYICLFLLFEYIQFGFQHLHRLIFIHVLGTFILTLYHNTGRQVSNTNGR